VEGGSHAAITVDVQRKQITKTAAPDSPLEKWGVLVSIDASKLIPSRFTEHLEFLAIGDVGHDVKGKVAFDITLSPSVRIAPKTMLVNAIGHEVVKKPLFIIYATDEDVVPTEEIQFSHNLPIGIKLQLPDRMTKTSEALLAFDAPNDDAPMIQGIISIAFGKPAYETLQTRVTVIRSRQDNDNVVKSESQTGIP
jgi:hypothetical protein